MRKLSISMRMAISLALWISPPFAFAEQVVRAEAVEDGTNVSNSASASMQCVSTGTPGAKDDNMGKANCQNVQEINSYVSQIVQLNTKNSAALKEEFQKFEKNWKACVARQSLAAKACLENLSEKIQSGTSAIGAVTAAGSMGSSANNSCDSLGKAMELANQALTAFNSACTLAKSQCQSSCQSGIKSLNKMSSLASSDSCIDPNTCNQAQLQQLAQGLASSIQKESNSKGDTISTAGKNQLCEGKYKELLASAMTGAMGILSTMSAAKDCKEKTDASTVVNCKDPAQANTPKCLCEKNPRLEGCSNGLEKIGGTEGSAEGLQATASSGMGTDSGDPSFGDLGKEDFSRDPANAEGGADGLPGAGGSSANLGGGGGSGSGSGNTPGGSGGRGLDTNVLAGTGGGGGGGGWGRGFGAGSSGLSNGNSKYGAYLPGGAKDPQLLNGNAWKNEVTSQGGKSNWDKIRERYLDNRTSLMPN